MKKNALLVLMLLMTSIIAGQALAAESPLLNPVLLTYTPVPAQPGSYITVTIQLTNNGLAPAKDAAIEFVDNYPFSVDTQSDKLQTVGMLGSKEDYLAEYRVRVDTEAVEGTNYLKVRYTSDRANNDTLWVEKKLPITISGTQKTVSINSVTVEPQSVTPGSQVNVNIKVKNLATSDLRDVGVKLNLEGMVVGSTYRDVPLAPIGSSIEKRISSLLSGQTADFEFVLQAYPEATAGIYKVPVTLSYTDTTGATHTRNDLISIVVNGGEDLLVQVDSTTLYSDNGKGDVTVSVTNRGLSGIKFLTVVLEKSDAYKIESASDVSYLGNLDSDDYETATFTIRMDQQGASEVTLPLKITFKDAMNKEYSMEKQLTLPLVSTSEAGKTKSKTGTVILIIVIVGLVAFLIYRSRKSKKKR